MMESLSGMGLRAPLWGGWAGGDPRLLVRETHALCAVE